MGACQCVERVSEDKQIVTTKNKTKFNSNSHELVEDGFGETKDHFLLTAKSGMKSITQRGEKEYILGQDFLARDENGHGEQVQNHETPSGVLNISAEAAKDVEGETEKQIIEGMFQNFNKYLILLS